MRPLTIALAILTLSGCEAAQCVSSTDCFRGEVCVDDQCVDEVDPVDMGSNPEDVRPGADMYVPPSDAGARADIGVADVSASMDMANPADDLGQPDMGSTAACLVDPFDACMDLNEEDGANDSWTDAYRLWSSTGCRGNDRDLVTPLDATTNGRICTLEAADWYALGVVACDTKTLIAEIRLDPDETHLECPAELAQLQLKFGGGDVPCDSGRYSIQCSRQGETSIIRMLLEPGSTIYSFQFGVTKPDGADVQYDYDLSVSISE